MSTAAWRLRPALPGDRDFLFALHRAATREYVELVWGWDEDAQVAFFDDRFAPERWQIVRAGDADVGVLIVERDETGIYLAEIELLPEWQGRGIGSAVIRSLTEEATASGKELTLRVLHANPRARALYERLGFRPFEEIETHTYLRWEASPAVSAG